ncbi:MAG: helix-turn-helix domain-containing protein [Actinomycetota bacterium]|nr:helix-turn-helix domain-containing protein [Actinomycetota bacterium]
MDAAAVDRAAIAESLSGYIAIDDKSHDVVTQPSFKSLSQPQQLVAYLLGVKAAALLGLQDQEGRSPSEVAKNTGVAPGTVRRILPDLAKKRLVSQDAGGRYFVAHHQVSTAIATIAGN